MRHRHPVALDVRATHRGGVEEQVDEVVVQQVDLVDVQHSAVGVGEQARLVGPDPVGQRALQVQRSDEPVLGGADGQLDEPRRAGVHARGRQQRQPVAPAHLRVGPVVADAPRALVRPVRAARVRDGRVAGEPAVGHHRHGGQQRGQRAHRRRLRRALLPAHQHPAHAGVHGVEQQRQAQVVVADDGGEREPDDVAVVRRDARHGGGHHVEPARPEVTVGSPGGVP
jgi:hypothetical protein